MTYRTAPSRARNFYAPPLQRRTGYRSNGRMCITPYIIVVESSGDAGVRVIKQGDLGRGRHGADDPD